MRCAKEVRRWSNKLKRRFGGKNGVVRSALWDAPEYERKNETSKNNYRRCDFKL